jgi:hypothetical protein
MLKAERHRKEQQEARMRVIEEHIKGIEAKIRDKEDKENSKEERKEKRVKQEDAWEFKRLKAEEEETQMRINMGLRPVYDTRLLQVRVQEYTHALAVMSPDAEIYGNFSSKNDDLMRFDQQMSSLMQFTEK